jgi:tetratricopeptide (TPR) repeat protein
MIILKDILGERHQDYATPLNNLALLYYSLGLYDKALLLFENSTIIYKSTLGRDHPNYATSLSNLANLYGDLGWYGQAETLFLQAIDIDKEAFGKEHPAYATDLNNLAFLYISQDMYENAGLLIDPSFVPSNCLLTCRINFPASSGSICHIGIFPPFNK